MVFIKTLHLNDSVFIIEPTFTNTIPRLFESPFASKYY